jgi:hypothetical protein
MADPQVPGEQATNEVPGGSLFETEIGIPWATTPWSATPLLPTGTQAFHVDEVHDIDRAV